MIKEHKLIYIKTCIGDPSYAFSVRHCFQHQQKSRDSNACFSDGSCKLYILFSFKLKCLNSRVVWIF